MIDSEVVCKLYWITRQFTLALITQLEWSDLSGVNIVGTILHSVRNSGNIERVW